MGGSGSKPALGPPSLPLCHHLPRLYVRTVSPWAFRLSEQSCYCKKSREEGWEEAEISPSSRSVMSFKSNAKD